MYMQRSNKYTLLAKRSLMKVLIRFSPVGDNNNNDNKKLNKKSNPKFLGF